jgi:hypothetical protein
MILIVSLLDLLLVVVSQTWKDGYSRGAGLAGGACSNPSFPNIGSDGQCYASCPPGWTSPNNNATCYEPCTVWNTVDTGTDCSYI